MSKLGMIGYLQGLRYRIVMRWLHRFNCHYAPPIYPEGDTQLWCQWCGFRQTIKYGKPREGYQPIGQAGPVNAPPRHP